MGRRISKHEENVDEAIRDEIRFPSIAGGVSALFRRVGHVGRFAAGARARSAGRSSVPTASRWRECRSSSATTSPASRPRRTTAADGSFQFFNVPFNPYELHVEAQGFQPLHHAVDVRSAARTRSTSRSSSQPSPRPSRSPRETTAAQLETDTSMSHVDIDKSYIAAGAGHRRLPGHGGADHRHAGLRQGRERPLPLPGLHSQSQVRDRRPDDLRPDRRHLLELDRPRHRPIHRGDLRQRARRVRREARHGRQHGHEVGPRHTLPRRPLRRRRPLRDLRGGACLGRRIQNVGLFGSVNGSRSDRFLDPVNSDNLHNNGDTQRGFLRLDFASPTCTIRCASPRSLGRTDRDVPNTYSQERAGQDQTVKSRDQNYNLGWTHILSAHGHLRRHGFGAPRPLQAAPVRERHARSRRLGPDPGQLRRHAVLHLGSRASTR